MTSQGRLTFGIVRIGDALVGVPIENLAEVFHSIEQQELPIDSDFLQGGISLRGTLVPLLNISLIGNFGNYQKVSKSGVVIQYKDRSISFFVDEIIGISNIKSGQISDVSDNNEKSSLFFKSVFSYQDKFVTILNVEDIFSVSGVFSATRPEEDTSTQVHKGPPMLTFVAGGALYSLPAVDVYAAVPKQIIAETSLTSGPCLGEITYHDRRIPVICPVSILGLGQKTQNKHSEVVVLRFPNDHLLGIAVDAIRDIRTFTSAKEAKIPLWKQENNFIDKALIQDDGEQIYVINVDQLRNFKQVVDLASLSEFEPQTTIEKTAEQNATSGNIIKERERYLVVELNKKVAIPLLQVSCILHQPNNVTPTKFDKQGFRGYFSRLGGTIAMIDLREFLGRGRVQSEKAQVLLTEYQGAQVGFLVDHVIGIEVSQWREKPNPADGKHEAVVQLGTGDTSVVLPHLDLSALNIHGAALSDFAPHPSDKVSA